MPLAFATPNRLTRVFLSKEELHSLTYHNVFDYPLTMAELVKWSAGPKSLTINHQQSTISNTNGFYHLAANPGAVLKRLMRSRISARKLEIAKKATYVISLVPTVKMVAVTGALAMENASDEADIDLLVVSKKGSLWTSRLLVHLVLLVLQIPVRRAGRGDEKDKLCLNMWLDESDLIWSGKRRNIYTAHEIAQVRPLVNRGQTYEEFIERNGWIREYWPNTVKITKKLKDLKTKKVFRFSVFPFFSSVVEKVAFRLQYAYMRKRITRETVTATRALFHPVDWSEYVLKKLSP